VGPIEVASGGLGRRIGDLMKGKLLYTALDRSGLGSLARRVLVRDGRFAILMHGVRPELPGVSRDLRFGIRHDELQAILGWLRSRFRLLTLPEFLDGSLRGVLVTFDDGLANNWTVALPLLERFDAPAVLFVSTQHVLEPRNWLPATRVAARAWRPEGDVPEAVAEGLFDGMDPEQVRAAGGHPLITIGSHSVTHPFLTRCSDEQLAAELRDSRTGLQELSGQDVDSFAYPTGDYDRRVAEAVRDAGYRVAFADVPRGVGLPAYEIPRVGVYGGHPGYLSAKLSGVHRRPVRRAYAS
jgi:peptidoglycan/xylan/chitin deacetylase (PgdA/CDA1 family)